MASIAAASEGTLLERRFRFAEHGTTLAQDSMAGVTTFIVMAYIIFLNPIILTSVTPHKGGTVPFDGVLTGTCVVAGVMTIIMGLYTNRAYALAPGLGINAIVAFQLIGGEGLSFSSAMGLIVLEGVVVTVLVLSGVREAIMRSIPVALKKAIAIGIGLFIAFIGLVFAGIVVGGAPGGPPVALGHLTTWPIFVAVFALVLTIVLRARRIRGDLLIGMIAATILATIINSATDHKAFGDTAATWPGFGNATTGGNWSLFGKFDFHAFSQIGVVTALVWVFALFLSDFFDTMGTLIGVGKPAGYLTPQGELPEIRKPLLVDSLAAIAGGASSTSSATTYIESGAGVDAGGRTGWVAVVTGLLFFPFLFLSPVIHMVPVQATAAALIMVGYLMISTLTESEDMAEPGATGTKLAGIDFHDLAIGLPCALVIIVMPLTYSITNGIGFGFIAYVLIRVSQGKLRAIHPLMLGAAGAFLLYFLVPLLQDHLSWV